MNDRLRNLNQKISKSTIQIQRLMSELSPIDPQNPSAFKSRARFKQVQYANPQDLSRSAEKRVSVQNFYKKNSHVQTNASTKFQQSKQKFYCTELANQKTNPFNHFSTQYNPRGQINKQTKFAIGHHLYPNSNPPKSQINNQKQLSRKNILKANKSQNIVKNIFEIDHNYVLKYVQSRSSLTPESKPQEIFDYFSYFASMFKKPLIKKFKNCLYFGESPEQSKYRSKYMGFLYFYTLKIYYGNFQQEHKHGLGVQINLKNKIVYKGAFNKGHKIGIFQVICGDKYYQGPLNKGKFHGFGKLETPISIYEGSFYNGMRHGQGCQFFYKSGLRLQGVFQSDKFCNDQQYVRETKREFESSKKRQKVQQIQSKSSQKQYNFVKLSNMFDFSFHDSSDNEQSNIQKKSNIKWKCVKRMNPNQKKQNKYQNKYQNSVMESASDDDPLPCPFRKGVYNK